MYNFFISKKAYTDWEESRAKKALKALRICINILERRTKYSYNDYNFPKGQKKYIGMSIIEDRDKEILYKLIEEYSEDWWD